MFAIYPDYFQNYRQPRFVYPYYYEPVFYQPEIMYHANPYSTCRNDRVHGDRPKRIKVEQRKKQQLLQKYNDAAIVIQRAFRQHLERKRLSAAAVISRALQRNYIKNLAQRNIIQPLKDLSLLSDQLNQLQDKFSDVFWGNLTFSNNGRINYNDARNKPFLMFEDSLMKMMLSIDNIQSNGEEIVRSRRKSLINSVQQLLNECDRFKHEEQQRPQLAQ